MFCYLQTDVNVNMVGESFVGLFLSEWDNRMNEAWHVWKRLTGSLTFDIYSEIGYHLIAKVQSWKKWVFIENSE